MTCKGCGNEEATRSMGKFINGELKQTCEECNSSGAARGSASSAKSQAWRDIQRHGPDGS